MSVVDAYASKEECAIMLSEGAWAFPHEPFFMPPAQVPIEPPASPLANHVDQSRMGEKS